MLCVRLVSATNLPTTTIVAHSFSRKLLGRSDHVGTVFDGKYLLLAELSASYFKLFSAYRPGSRQRAVITPSNFNKN